MKKMTLLLFALVMISMAFSQVDITIGTGTSNSYYPLDDSYVYSRTQSLYLASEIHSPGTIHVLRWYRHDTGADPAAIGTTQIWLTTTNNTAISGTAWEDPGTLVATISDIDLGEGDGWYTVDIDDYYYAGDNLLVSVYTQNATVATPNARWRYTSTSSTYLCRAGHNNTTNPPNMSTTYNRPNIQINMTPDAATVVPNPAVLVGPLDDHYAYLDEVLSWLPEGPFGSYPTAYDVYIDNVDGSTLVSNDQTETTYTPTLVAGTTYYWKVVPSNSIGEATGCPVWSFTTPTAIQLQESFEGDSFPPPGWATIGTAAWTQSTSYPVHGTHTAYKYASSGATNQYILSTPPLAITTGSELNFWSAASNVAGFLEILWSTDRETWTLIGTTSYAVTYTAYESTFDLSSLTPGNYYIGFQTGLAGNYSYYVDKVTGPELAPIPPDPAILPYPSDGGWAFTDEGLSWSPGGGGIQDGYDVYLDTVDGSTLVSNNQTETTYTPTLAAGTTYYWKVVPYNGYGSATGCPVWSFKTPTATQLAESFETLVPPTGWMETNGTTRWTQNTYHMYGSYCAQGYGTASAQYVLSTPRLTIDVDSELDFWSQGNNLSSHLDVVWSADRETWNLLQTIDYTATYTWKRANIDLSSLAGNYYYLGFRTAQNTYREYIDHVIGPEFAPLVPGEATLLTPVNGAVDQSDTSTTLTWTVPASGGVPTYYGVFMSTSEENIFDDLYWETTNTYFNPVSEGGFTFEFSTDYFWTVAAYNASGPGDAPTPFRFTTWDDPVISVFPWEENFDTTTVPDLPTHWTVAEGDATANTHWSTTTSDPYNGASGPVSEPNFAYLNCAGAIYTHNPYYMITRPLSLGTSPKRLGYWYWIGHNAYTAPDPDPLFVDISTDLVNWTRIYTHDHTHVDAWTPNYVSLEAYASSTVYLRFGGNSNWTGDSDFCIDNIVVDDLPTAPMLSVGPASWDFGLRHVDATVSQQFYAYNSGFGSLTVSDINIAGDAEFTLTGLPALPIVLLSGESTTFTVQYHPTVVGTHSATVSITDNLGRTVTDVPVNGEAGLWVDMSNGSTTIQAGQVWNFYDSGGATGTYGFAENYVWTFNTPAGYGVQVDFVTFDTQPNFDSMHIYDGATIEDPELTTGIWGMSGPLENLPQTHFEAGGPMTFRFTSDFTGSGYTGWHAIVTLYQLPIGGAPVVTISRTGGVVSLSWDAVFGANSYLVYGADDPYGTFSLLTTTDLLTYDYLGTEGYKFFKVVASTDPMP
jgi:hypothetical protein